MKAAEVRRLSTEELNQRLTDLSDELFRLKFQLISGQIQNYKHIKQIKKDKARAQTIIRERELQINQSLPVTEAASVEE